MGTESEEMWREAGTVERARIVGRGEGLYRGEGGCGPTLVVGETEETGPASWRSPCSPRPDRDYHG